MGSPDEIAFHPLRIPSDVDLVHGWMQQPHVAQWWDLAGPREITRDYLYARARVMHRDCWIASDRRTPVAYVETFVVPDDPLGERYAALPGDRGFDLLIGPPALLGSGTAQRVVRRLVGVLLGQHGIERIVCACVQSNARQIAFCGSLGAGRVADLDGGGVLLAWSSTAQLAGGPA